jgi:hypothetical protein
MDNFDLKRFLVENKLTRNSILSELDYDMSNNSYFGTPTTTFDKFKKERSIKWTKDALEQEADKYNTVGEFRQADINAYNIYKIAVRKGLIQDKFERSGFGNKWTKDALEQEADKYNSATEFNQNNRSAYQSYINAVNKGLIQNKFKRSGFGNKWTKDALEQEAAKYNTSTEFKQNNNSAYITYINAVNKGLIQSKFKGVEKNGRSIKWTKDALEQEADKYNTASEFRQADINAYTIYMAAVRKDIIQNKFEPRTKWTIEKVEQEAAKYNTPTEFQKTNSSAYQAYLLAVKKGLIPDRFENNRINTKWTSEKLEQEAAKYNTQNDFFKTDLAAFVAYKRAVKKGLIQDKFKKDKPTINENKMQDFDLKHFLVENHLTRNSTLNEMAKPPKWTPDALEQEAAKYKTPKEFQKADINLYNIYRIAVRKGIIQDKFENQNRDTSNYYSKNRWTPDALEQEAAKYKTPKEFQQENPSAYLAYRKAVNKGLIQNKFEEQFRWTPDALEQEAAKYKTSGEFQKANINTYSAYRRAVNKGLIQNKFKSTGFGTKWTKDALEQEAAKYDTASEFQKANATAYIAYRKAVNFGLIKDKFKEFKTTLTDTLEQEAAKYNTPEEFKKANSRTYYAYMYAVKKGLIQDKFKQAGNASVTTQSINYPNNNPYFGTPTTTFDKLKENKMDNFDLKRFLVENKMTRNSRLLNEDLTYETLPAEVKQRYENNGRIGVAFVKKDGSVRHMSFSKTLKAYQPSAAAKTDAQANYRQNNNLWSGYDVNAYIKAKKETGDDAAAAKQSFRNFKLENVLAFSSGGKVFDMRDENNIAERFGEDVANALTKSMIQALERDSAATAEPTTDETPITENAKPEDIGKGTRLIFKDDKTTYYANGSKTGDKKYVFVTKGNDDTVYRKAISKIIQIDNKKF